MQIKSKEIPHYCQNGKQKGNKQKLLVKMHGKGTLMHCWWHANTMGNSMKVPQKLKIELLYSPDTPRLSIYLKETKSLI